MGRLKELIKKAPVHERRLEFRSYPLEEDQLVVEGRLRDERLVPGYRWDGHPRPPGVIHWMTVRILVSGWPLSILDAEAEMDIIPHELCPTTLDSVKRIVGMSIIHGFSEEVHKRLGGIQGCAHLTALITSLGPAAIHGYWTQRSRKRHPLPRSLEEFPALDTLTNSCRLWKEDGPLMEMIHRVLQDRDQEHEVASGSNRSPRTS